MAETFPIKCTTCSEIVDVATHMVVGAAYNCPMCGADTAIAEAEDYELPCPAAVVIEEQTPERLRLRVVESPRGSDGYYLGLLFLGVGLVILNCAVVEFAFTFRFLEDPFFFLIYGVCSLGTGAFQLTAARLLDLKHTRMTVRYQHLGLAGFPQRTRLDKLKCVYMTMPVPMFWPFRYCQVVIGVGSRFHKKTLILAHNPDIARYVTHLIRRQLLTMGHELQDG